MRGRHVAGQAASGRASAVRRGSSRRRMAGLAAAAVVMGLAACAGPDGPGSGGTASEPAGPSGEPVNLDLPVLRVHSSGGFLPPGWDFARVPELTVYPDGRAITHGPQIAIYPPPALPNLVVRALTASDVDALVTAARDAGLLNADVVEYGHPTVADAGTTVVTLYLDGRSFTHSAEALGVVDGVDGWVAPPDADVTELPRHPPEAPSPQSAAEWGLTEDELAARAELAHFVARAHELAGAAQETGPYVIEAFAVTARPATDPAGPDTPPDELVPPVLPWPLEMSLADAAECVVVGGEEARTLHEVLLGTAFTVQFEQAGSRYEAWFRPLLPHERACADL